MLDLPQSTEYGKRIPKTKFYKNLQLSNKVKKHFINEIETIIWQNKISPDTIGLDPGKEVSEIEVIEIKLHQKKVNKNILEIIDHGIPYHIIFILTYGKEAQLAVGYKERLQKKDDKYKVEAYFFSEWLPLEELSLELHGLNLDRIYENLLRQFIPKNQPQLKTLKETISLQQEIGKQKAICDALEKKIRKEKQFNIQVRLNSELRKERVKLEVMMSKESYRNFEK